MSVTARIHSFETFGTFDGPGIRFVIFMQGCPFRCLYCHNPDTWNMNSGDIYTVSEVLDRIKRFIPFLKASGGGVTVSGGEPLMQTEFLTELFKQCKDLGLHTAVDTNGYYGINNPHIDNLLKYTDLVLLDIKHINPDEHKKITGFSNHNTLEFAKYLNYKKIPTWIRYVLVPGLTDDTKSVKDLKSFVNQLSNVINIEILPYHNKGEYKWRDLKIDYKLCETEIPSEKEIYKVKEILYAGLLHRDTTENLELSVAN